MKIIIGLGNPGKKYQLTRHNVGFLALDLLASHYKLTFKLESKFQASVAEMFFNNEKILLVKPQTFMNLSGISVNKIIQFYQLSAQDIIVVSDDINLPIGSIRIRTSGSHGGQNGLRNIIEHLKTNDFIRLRIGIDENGSGDLSNYVLSTFSKAEQARLEEVFNNTLNALIDYIQGMPIEKIMTKYN